MTLILWTVVLINLCGSAIIQTFSHCLLSSFFSPQPKAGSPVGQGCLLLPDFSKPTRMHKNRIKTRICTVFRHTGGLVYGAHPDFQIG